MPYAEFPLIGDFKTDFDTLIDPQTLVNMYYIPDQDSPYGKALAPIPGSRQVHIFPEASNTEVRGVVFTDDYMYWVVANVIYRISSSGGIFIPSVIGTITTSSGYISIAQSATEILFVDGTAGHLYDGSTLSLLGGSFPSNPVMATYLDGRFQVAQGTSSKYFFSAINDGSSWNVNDFNSLTTTSNNLVAIAQLKRRLYVMNDITTEIWYDAGNPQDPYLRDNNQVFNFGCAARGSVAISHGYLVFLARSAEGTINFVFTDGSDINVLSTSQVELAIQEYTSISDARAYLYEMNGHLFYVCSFTTDNKTWTCDLTTKTWFNQQMLDKNRYFSQCHVFFDNRHYVGAYNEPIIYRLDKDFATNHGEAIYTERTSPVWQLTNGLRAEINFFEIQMRQGNNRLSDSVEGIYYDDSDPPAAYVDDAGSPYYDDTYLIQVQEVDDPVVYLSVSRDGGRTYGYDMQRSMGEIGEYTHRTIWRQFGMAESFVFKVTHYNRTPCIIVGANFNYNPVRV